jgi:hypothetical protein
MTTPYVCPDCGSALYIDETAETEDLIFKKDLHQVVAVRRPAVVAFCSGCEFSLEIKKEDR